MTTDPLADALAELRNFQEWSITDFNDGFEWSNNTSQMIATILNAALSGELMRKSEHLAIMAAGNEAAADIDFPETWRDDAHEVHAGPGLKAQRTWSAGFKACRNAIRSLTTADQQAALDRVIQAARAVKPLVWGEKSLHQKSSYDSGGYSIEASSVLGTYRIDKFASLPGLMLACVSRKIALPDDADEEAAKAAAQADYTARIHAALADGEPT